MKHVNAISKSTPKMAMKPNTIQEKKCVKKGDGGCFPGEFE